MIDPDLDPLETDLVLEAVNRRFGFDFRGYSRASLERRIRNVRDREGLRHVAELIPRLLHDPSFVDQFVNGISVNVTEPFRDPEVFAALRTELFPVLETYPYFKIWHAGCASGEEIYSLAILLHEADLLDRAQIYATDINTEALARARDGIYPLDSLRKAEAGYRKAGGQARLADYYTAQYGAGRFASMLRSNLVCSQHNLVTDAPFGEMVAVICRNVLIYFTRDLQDRVISLFHASLARRGFLTLGTRESLAHIPSGARFEASRPDARIYRAL